MIARALQSAYGQKAGERSRIPTLIPVMYALARLGIFRYINNPSTISQPILTAIASTVRDKLSSKPNESWLTNRISVMKIGGRYRLSAAKKRLIAERAIFA